MFKKKVYVNETKKKANVWVVGITMLIMGITWTSNYYMFQDLQKDYNRAITIYNISKENRIERSGIMVQDIEEASTQGESEDDVTSNGAEVQASLNGVDGVRSPSTVEEHVVEMSAYTSRVEETDSSPCISADGTNICEYDGCVVASNDYKIGTKVEVEGFGVCTVKDRMNKRYTGTGNMDIYFKYDLQGALAFGRRNVNIKVI